MRHALSAPPYANNQIAWASTGTNPNSSCKDGDGAGSVSGFGDLAGYPKMLKPGGKLPYATCSIPPSEARDQITRLLANLPSETGHSGFHASLLVKQ